MIGKSFSKLLGIYKTNLAQFPALLEVISDELGVSVDSLRMLETGLNPKNQSWIFPERDEKGRVIGLAERSADGKKFMVPGSKRGLTFAMNYNKQEQNYISGKQNWTRVSKNLPCPLCEKIDGCLLPAGKESDPPAIVCVHTSKGAVKELGLGFLHILKPEKNVAKRILSISEHPILVVEGQTDVAAAFDLGFVAIGRPSATGGMTLLPQLLVGKDVIVIGENDKSVGKKGMDSTFANLKKGCKSIIKILPPDDVKDLRRWKNLYNLTMKSFLAYVDENGDKDENPDLLKDDIAHTIADAWIKREKILDNRLILRNHRGRWIEYQKNCYEKLEIESFRGQLYKFLDGKAYCHVNANGDINILPYKPTRAKINDIIDALNHWCPILENPPVWLSENDKPDPINLIAFQNGILDVQKYIQGEICLYNPTPDFFTFDILPYDFDENAESPIWNNFVEDIYNSNREKIQLLAQWFGYNCVPDLSFEKLMLFTGRPRSGKSTVLETMQSMLGEKQCCETSFQSLSGPFGYQPLMDKFAAVIGDAKSPKMAEGNAVLEKILHITGGDAVSVNRKGIQELPIVHLKCRFTIAMNDLPTFTDHARALEPRLSILVFDNSYVGREDRTLKRRLKKEANEGRVINFALRGLKDLRTRKNFITPISSLMAMKQFQELASPAVTFVSECCEIEPPDAAEPYFASKDQLYEIWQAWCNNQGRKPGLKEQFGRWFLAACPEATTIRKRVDDKRLYVFEGVRLSDWVFKNYLGKG